MVEGSARRLPSWMTSEPTQTTLPKHTTTTKKPTSTQTSSNNDSFSLHKSQTTSTKPPLPQIHRTNKRKRPTSTKRTAKAHHSIPLNHDDDEYFTVDDLVSIAHQCVKNEEEKLLLNTEVRSQKKNSGIGSSMSDVEGAVIGGDSEQVESSDKIVVESSEQCRVEVKRSGDPAQDMLELFLGPLLNKPVEEAKRFDRLTNDMDFSCQLVKENRHDFQEEMVVPSKKKSSLKNKVSVLLD